MMEGASLLTSPAPKVTCLEHIAKEQKRPLEHRLEPHPLTQGARVERQAGFSLKLWSEYELAKSPWVSRAYFYLGLV